MPDIAGKLFPNLTTLIVQLLSTGVLLLIFKKFLWKNVMEYFAKRADYIESTINEAKEMNEKAMEILKVFDLDKEADTLAGNLPYGKQRKLEIARALATNPKLLLLDEPAAGMNPNETQELMDTIRFVQKHFDMTILLIEHDMKLVGGICEEVTVLNFGQVLAQGETLKVLKDPAVVTAYLGE